MPIFADVQSLDTLIQILVSRIKRTFGVDLILGIESRGFLFGPLLAHSLKLPFVPVRKKGKLPGKVLSMEYELEYGSDTLELQANCLPSGSRCLLVDDLIATGGSLNATMKMVEKGGAIVAGCAVIIELEKLGGRKKLGDTPLITLYTY